MEGAAQGQDFSMCEVENPAASPSKMGPQHPFHSQAFEGVGQPLILGLGGGCKCSCGFAFLAQVLLFSVAFGGQTLLRSLLNAIRWGFGGSGCWRWCLCFLRLWWESTTPEAD